MAGSFEPRRADRGADACSDLKRGAGTDDHRPCTNRHQPIVNKAWRGTGPLYKAYRIAPSDVVAVSNVHGYCPALAAFVRLCSLGSIETLPSPRSFATLLVLRSVADIGRSTVAGLAFVCGTCALHASIAEHAYRLSMSYD